MLRPGARSPSVLRQLGHGSAWLAERCGAGGIKVAQFLSTRYDLLPAEFAAGLRTKLRAAAGYLAVAPKVVEVARDAPVPGIDTALPGSPADPDGLMELAQRWNLAGPIRRLVDAIAGTPGQPD